MSSHLDIYPRNSIWESAISAPLPIAERLQNIIARYAIGVAYVKSYVTNGRWFMYFCLIFFVFFNKTY